MMANVESWPRTVLHRKRWSEMQGDTTNLLLGRLVLVLGRTFLLHDYEPALPDSRDNRLAEMDFRFPTLISSRSALAIRSLVFSGIVFE